MEDELVQKRTSPCKHSCLSRVTPAFWGPRALFTLQFWKVFLGGSTHVLYLLERTDFPACRAHRPTGSDCITRVTGDHESISWAIEKQTAQTAITQHKLKLQELRGSEHMRGIRQLHLYPKLRYFPGFKIGMSEECLSMSPESQTWTDGEGIRGKQNFSSTYARAFRLLARTIPGIVV